MMKNMVLLLGIALSVSSFATLGSAKEHAITARIPQLEACKHFARQMRADFASYRLARRHQTATAQLNVGIVIVGAAGKRSRGTAESKRPLELRIFRRKQMQTIAQMRHEGCRT